MLCSTCVMSLCHIAYGTDPVPLHTRLLFSTFVASCWVLHLCLCGDPSGTPFSSDVLPTKPGTDRRVPLRSRGKEGGSPQLPIRRRDVCGTCDDRCVPLLRDHVRTCCDPPAASRGAKDAGKEEKARDENEKDKQHGRTSRASFFFFFICSHRRRVRSGAVSVSRILRNDSARQILNRKRVWRG